jgi:succinyl-CoA synthetase beta subunit
MVDATRSRGRLRDPAQSGQLTPRHRRSHAINHQSAAARLQSAAVDLYEHQGKELFAGFGIPVSEGRVATTPAEARQAAAELGGQVVVKAQVLTGGRGKAGGIKLADDPDDAAEKAEAILGLSIRGHEVRRLWIERASDIEREYYLSVTLDRGAKQALLMFTTEGGVEIEQVAAESPEALVRVHVDPLEGLTAADVEAVLAPVADDGERAQIAAIVEQLYRCFVESDALLCEINPLIVVPGGQVRALDSKVTIDDSALFRHPDLAEWRDTSAADPLEAYARERNVTYVKLDGSVGILGNGAGLSMSTVDVVVVAGGRPANFCDLGGGGSAEGVVDALEVITRDPQVRAIFFNIFGGITRCDEVARGILEALTRTGISLPLVVRLDGTNAEDGRRILAEAALPNVHVEPTMLAAAHRAVELAG